MSDTQVNNGLGSHTGGNDCTDPVDCPNPVEGSSPSPAQSTSDKPADPAGQNPLRQNAPDVPTHAAAPVLESALGA